MLNEKLKLLVEKQMMRSVSQRYALLYKIGVSHKTLSMMDLEGTPNMVGGHLLGHNGLVYWEGKELSEKLIDLLINEPLPEGIPGQEEK